MATLPTPGASSTSPELEPICNTCKKPSTSFPNPLKKCAKCQLTKYCSRECQKNDWKAHKKICAAQSQDASAASSGQHNPGFEAANALLGLSGNDSLHSLSEKDVFTQLIDCFRLRCEDEYAYGGNAMGIYDGGDAVDEFEEFLDLEEKRKGVLPAWWSKGKREECVRWAMGGSEWADISCAVEKSDIVEHYGDGMMPMRLRVLGEKIYGRGFM